MNLQKRLVLLILVIELTLPLFALSMEAPPVEANPGTDLPTHIHLTFQDDPSAAVTITWQTKTFAAGAVVLYDTVPRGGDPSLYSRSVTGLHHTYHDASGYIHDVEVTGLDPDTRYYFICGGAGNYSAERAFTTAPQLASDFRFVVGGDSRTFEEDRAKVSEAMRHTNPDVVLHSGDMVEYGGSQSQWDSWFADVEEKWIDDEGRTLPLIPCVGNHEKNATHYYEQFALPGNEQWYYYDWGPTLRIIVLNSEATPSQIATDQANWLRTVLFATPENTWKIVMFHRNVYYSGGHSNATDLMKAWVPYFDKYHVDIVFQGHTHHYHRTKPMKNNTVVSSYEEGTMYVTSAGWGAPLYEYYEQPYSAYGKKVLHFTLVHVYQNGTLRLEGKDIAGSTFDAVTLYKNVSDAPPQYRPPEADAGVNRVIDEDTLVTFDGSNSLNSTTVETYTWTVMDGVPQTLAGVSVEYTFTTPGSYVVTLNVTDVVGEWNTDTLTLTVRDVTPPVADAGVNQQGTVNTQVAFDASGSSDNVGIISYTWDFGDGTTGTGVSTTHIFTEPVTYDVTVTVIDTAGNSDVDMVTVTVEAESPFSTWTILLIGAAAIGVVAVAYLRRGRPSQSQA
jgi:predicted phosphodiesterase